MLQAAVLDGFAFDALPSLQDRQNGIGD